MKRLSEQLKREFNLPAIAFFSLSGLVILATIALLSFLIYKKAPALQERFAKYLVCGTVKEFGSEASVGDFQINYQGEHLYSLWDGSFCWDDLPKEARLSFSLPEEFEADKTAPCDYRDYKSLSPLKRKVICNIELVLSADATAKKVFTQQTAGSFSSLWRYLTTSSRADWSNKEVDFVSALRLERRQRAKYDQSQPVKYQIKQKWLVDNDRWRYQVEWTLANGKTVVSEETLIKQEGWWHYQYPRSPKEVYKAISFFKRFHL